MVGTVQGSLSFSLIGLGYQGLDSTPQPILNREMTCGNFRILAVDRQASRISGKAIFNVFVNFLTPSALITGLLCFVFISKRKRIC